ncbi:SGNH/GDSL hydrolase family protein [Xylanibacter caecicola]|uniref:SGNH/GDSL hydrolase family protein n=1 Tax=Xylanibacter caecicola TaxID=2736294 RepID=UPI00258C1B86|nr:SGNH/GDSL hydrolase family protein [Xylanibacter caecicola]
MVRMITFMLSWLLLYTCNTGVRAQHAGISAVQANSNMNVVILGDSNTSIGGDACDRPQGWSKWFRDKFAPATCRSYARSGATWTNTVRTTYNTKEYTEKLSDNNVIYNQVNRLKEDCDAKRHVEPNLILIAAGTNDAWFSTSRPGVFSKTADNAFEYDGGFITGRKASDIRTLAGSVRYCCEMLMERFPDAQIILLTPMQSVAAGTDGIRRAGDIIEGCAHRMGLCVIRQDRESCVYYIREKKSARYTIDGTHTSEDGARRNGCYIANRVSAMLQM